MFVIFDGACYVPSHFAQLCKLLSATSSILLILLMKERNVIILEEGWENCVGGGEGSEEGKERRVRVQNPMKKKKG